MRVETEEIEKKGRQRRVEEEGRRRTRDERSDGDGRYSE